MQPYVQCSLSTAVAIESRWIDYLETLLYYRSKWDEYRGTDTYGDITNKNAISKSKTFYTPIQKLSAYDDFDDKIHVEQS